MADREKVLKGLECCNFVHFGCDGCPYDKENDSDVANIGRALYEQAGEDTGIFDCYCMILLHKDALALLKAQEPVAPYMDYDGQDVWRCGSCGATLFHLSHTQADENEQNCVKFCRYCGKAVKRDDND